MSEPHLPTAEPSPTLETERFWRAAADGTFVLPRCDACDAVVWYPRRFCPSCHRADRLSWFEATGRGTVYSFTVVRQAPGPWKQAVPYVIAYVELEEGPRILTNIVGCDADDVVVGLHVEVVFDRSPEGAGVYRFTPSVITPR
jgi:uncharacterized OB-fold protein